jgi:peptidoglycan DL-endopeptidase CwlO
VKKIAVLGAAAVALYAGTAGHGAPVASTAHASGAAATAIDYAQQQIGRPYIWGGPTAPGTSGGFDCSGLAQAAWAAAGVSIPRTSEEQWAAGPQVPASQAAPGDLVFFAGSDGTATSPGHVGIVTGPGQMIDGYGSGTDVRSESYGLPSSAPGLANPVGFTDPAAAGKGA